MKWIPKFPILIICLFSPAICAAQSWGQVECARAGDYVYLYSSMVTLEVRSTLQCGEQVQIIAVYDSYFSVRTAKGETGFVPIASLLLLKGKPAGKPAQPEPKGPVITYDPRDEHGTSKETTPDSSVSAHTLTLRDGTPIRVKLGRTISSANAKVGDQVDFEVLDEVVVEGFSLVRKGAMAIGVVTEAEPKRRLGRGGKLSVSIISVRLTNDEKADLRSVKEGKGSSSTAGAIFPMKFGKDVEFSQGAEFTAYVNGDKRLKRENFHAGPNSGTGSASSPQEPPRPHN
jgi:hypothetical protein